MRYRGRLRQELARCLIGGSIDLLLLQEHHLTERRIRSCGPLLRGHRDVFWSPAFGPSGSQGGVCMSIADTMRSTVLDRGVVVPGRAQWMLLQQGQLRIGVLNVYAPNHASARVEFWTQIVESLPPADGWCVGGDFNMLEDASDRRGGSQTTVHGSELAAWEDLCMTLRIEDVWHHPAFVRDQHSLLFSRSDRRVGGTNLSRLDRMYVSDFFGSRGGTISIIAGTCLSDHYPVVLSISEGRRTGASAVRIPESLQTDTELTDQIGECWTQLVGQSDAHARSCADGLEAVSLLLRGEATRRLAEARETERRLHRSVATLMRQLERQPASEWVGSQLLQAQQELRVVQDIRSEFVFHRQASHWSQVGDRVTGEFFRITGPRHSREGVIHLRRPDGTFESDPVGMREMATSFYRDLLSAESESESVLECRQQVLGYVRRSVTLEMCGQLLAPFSETELLTALKALPRHSCPGRDGLSPIFFLEHWDLLKEGLLLAFQEIMDSGFMPESLSEGMIFLIPKEGGNRDELRHWRPITILNSAYKILAKALSLRLQPMLENIIHATQTGFVLGRSILDNVFTFWEAISLARLQDSPLAVLLLDFEKAYDRVDWGFLEETMLCMGFPDVWVRGVAALYRSAHSQVLLAGDTGDRFRISRSVRQGCPLAPFLFLFFAEAMSSFLSARDTGLQGLRLPIRDEEILDAEFADDTAMYLEGNEVNLLRFQAALEVFCVASGAKINWHKSCGFWVGAGPPPCWAPDPSFRWVPSGTAVRYLGCQVGLDLSMEQQVAPLLLSIRRKLLFWSSAHLSLAGRVVVANQVLLATMWYITSCWIFSRSCINQVQRLIRNFLWSGGDGRPARAKVAWSVITLPPSHGGLGIIDPICQSRALLGKFVVRCLLPGSEPWKLLLLSRLGQRVPAAGGPWQPEIRWIFTELRRVGLSRQVEARFACSILRSWELLRPALTQSSPTTADELYRQPLVWNPLVRTRRGHMVGSRPHVSWGAMASGPAQSLGVWLQFQHLTELTQRERLTGMRGSAVMIQDISEAIPAEWTQEPPLLAPSWMGAFTGTEVLIAVRGCSDSVTVFFEIGIAGQLLRVDRESELLRLCTFQRVRVLGQRSRRWVVDPSPHLVAGQPGWRLWAWDSRPLARLQWDPGEWHWRDPFAPADSPPVPFFQYTVRLGRHILVADRQTRPAAAEHWRRQGLSQDFLSGFWRRLWGYEQSRRSVVFQWLVAHRGVAVGTWLRFGGLPPDCTGCGYFAESQRHCLWDCPLAQQIWIRILRLLPREGQLFTWGAVSWGSLTGPGVGYETEVDSVVLQCQRQLFVRVDPPFAFPLDGGGENRDPHWELISSLALWFVWRARCRRVFEDRVVPPAETIRDFWLELIHTLRGQFDRMQGESDRAGRRREAFLRLWGHPPFCSLLGGTVRWCYRPPVWLFPPPRAPETATL